MTNTHKQTDAEKRLQDHVQSIADDINHGIEITKGGDHDYLLDDDGYEDGDYMRAGDYIQDVLDIEYIVDARCNYKSARLLVAFGGPNIWVDLDAGKVKGYWWGDYAETEIDGEFFDEIDQFMHELYNCR